MPPRPERVRTMIADGSGAFSSVVRRWIETRPELKWIATVGSGREALAVAEQIAPDLVLVDAVLPELDGFRVVRELNRLQDPPLAVVVTFESGAGARRAAIDAGASGFVPKDEFADGMDALLPELLRRLDARIKPRAR